MSLLICLTTTLELHRLRICAGYTTRDPGYFGPYEPHRWNSTYVILKEVIGHRDVLTMWINKELNEPFLGDDDSKTAGIILEFLSIFHLVTSVFSTIYLPNSHIPLHNIFETSKHFAWYRNHNLLGRIVLKIEGKF